MITVENQKNVLDRLDKIEFEFRGMSDDDKPGVGTGTYLGADIANGSIFLEMDTQKIWFYDEATAAWVGNEEE